MAILDLQGFSAHLELANSDFRTELGSIASRRLDILENAVRYLLEEKKELPTLYPNSLDVYRLNDALYIYCDLPSELCPEIGRDITLSISPKDLVDSYPHLLDMKEDDAILEIENKIASLTSDVMLFAGVVCRVFNYINKQEHEMHMPGCKGVVSAGIRRKYVNGSGRDDIFSLNLALAKSYIAGGNLHGSNIYFDIDTLRLLCAGNIGRHLVTWALQKVQNGLFNPSINKECTEINTTSYEIERPISTSVFRKEHRFYRMNPNPLGFAQVHDYKRVGMGSGKVPGMIIKAFEKMGDGLVAVCPMIFRCYNTIDSSLTAWFPAKK